MGVLASSGLAWAAAGRSGQLLEGGVEDRDGVGAVVAVRRAGTLDRLLRKRQGLTAGRPALGGEEPPDPVEEIERRAVAARDAHADGLRRDRACLEQESGSNVRGI